MPVLFPAFFKRLLRQPGAIRLCSRQGLKRLSSGLMLSSAPLWAAADESASVAQMPVSGVEVLGSLLLVLALIFGLAWLARVLQGARQGDTTAIRIQAGAQVGPKERVVLLQVGEVQMLVGVAQGSVTVLHRFDPPLAASQAALATPQFAQRLRQALGGRS
ncbi:flagellar biosynthetic protein FliO [Sinimarinibacterium sp. NLF-5-8]|uniref:flagellar biosynthetic protein FliO n=1 Tax=Sinimarinibacterium sp. NLF-5-8 TaxID=2698684 RepID=UPI00137B9D1D|nr:flagellar biosynthetic protein FliO [Sinimarinibacterium sp. NLF-5-8]QHS09249.1 flagellar biosynthetic protein FliO [Sinimarinibacterium sp. NLF-5-8]